MFPSEYAYHRDSVYRTERDSANCRNYPKGLSFTSGSEEYIHCDGTALRLTDSDLGPEQYNSSEYYVWDDSGSRSSQLLFIFPTRVNLTTITLHYYSDRYRGLPRLKFNAVPDDFDIWETLSSESSYRYAEVAAISTDEEPAGHRNISVHFRFNTMKIRLFRFRTSLKFALSELQFIASVCSGQQVSTTVSMDVTMVSSHLSTTTSLKSATSTTESRNKSQFINL